MLIQDIVELLGAVTSVPNQVDQDARINRAAARAHHEAVERRKTHRGVDAFSAADRSQRRATSEMADDEFQRRRICSQHFGSAAGCVLMADSMEPVAPDALVEPVPRPRINVSAWLKSGMEPRIENSG